MTESGEANSYVIERVRTALARDPRVNELGISVTIIESKVFLRGTVSTATRQQRITEVVRELLPHHEIHNDVRVDVPASPTAAEKFR
jgi:osmotically-inducible protein OsmY